MKAMKAAKAMKAVKAMKAAKPMRAVKSKKKGISEDEAVARCCLNLTTLKARESAYNYWKTTNDAYRERVVISKEAIEEELRDVKTSIRAEPESHHPEAIRRTPKYALRRRLAQLEVGLLRCDSRIKVLKDESNEVERRLGPIKKDKAYWTRRQDEILKKTLGGDRRRRINEAAEATINAFEGTGPAFHDDLLGTPAASPPSSAATSSTGERQDRAATPSGIAPAGLAADVLGEDAYVRDLCGDAGHPKAIGTFPRDLFGGPSPGHRLPDQTKGGIMVRGSISRCGVGK
jgi:hypothetical protein